MSDDLHPHWQATDAGEENIPVHTAEHTPPKSTLAPPPPPTSPRHLTTVSRQPAAFAGIFLVLTIGIALFAIKGAGTLSADATIRVTSGGFSPQVMTVSPGTQVRWINETTIPHILQSDTLCTVSHRCLLTAPIAPGVSTSVIITDAFTPGTYAYYSISAQGFVGSLVVTAAPKNAPVKHVTAQVQEANFDDVAPAAEEPPAAPPSPDEAPPSLSAHTTPPPIAPDDAGAASSPATDDTWKYSFEDPLSAVTTPSASPSPSPARAAASALIPANPYTVGSNHPAPGEQGTATTEGLHSGAPFRPLSQPETGPAAWVAGLLTASLLLVITRRSLMRWHA